MDFISRLTPAARLHPLRSGPAPPSGGRVAQLAGCLAAAATLSANGRPIRASSRQRWTCARHSRCSSPLPATVFSSWSRTRRAAPSSPPISWKAQQGVVERHPQHRPHAHLAGRRLSQQPSHLGLVAVVAGQDGAQSRKPSSDRIRMCRRASSSPAMACPRNSSHAPRINMISQRSACEAQAFCSAVWRRRSASAIVSDCPADCSASADPAAAQVPFRGESSAHNSDTPGRPSPVLA